MSLVCEKVIFFDGNKMVGYFFGRCFKERDIVLLLGKEEVKKVGSRNLGGSVIVFVF